MMRAITIGRYRFVTSIEFVAGLWHVDCECFDCGESKLSFWSAASTERKAQEVAAEWVREMASVLGVEP